MLCLLERKVGAEHPTCHTDCLWSVPVLSCGSQALYHPCFRVGSWCGVGAISPSPRACFLTTRSRAEVADRCTPLAGGRRMQTCVWCRFRSASLSSHADCLTCSLLLPHSKYQGAASSLVKQGEVPILSELECVAMAAAQHVG